MSFSKFDTERTGDSARWVCTSGLPSDLETTDRLALEVLEGIVKEGVPKEIEQQYSDNIKWITEASKHKMVVGSQVRLGSRPSED